MNTLGVTLSRPAGFSGPKLFIEQEEPDPADGYLSRAGLYLAVLALLDPDVEQVEPDCQPGCGTFLYVYRYDLALNYTLYASHGQLGERVREDDLVFTEKVKFSMEQEQSLRYPNFGVVDARWLGGSVWDRDGARTTPPAMTTSIDRVRLDRIVYGTLLLTYRINRDTYTLALPRREEAAENKYSSVAFAIYRGGPPVWLEIDVPPGVEETDQQCRGGGGGGLDHEPPDPEDFDPPHAPNTDAKVVIDYCTQEVISDSRE